MFTIDPETRSSGAHPLADTRRCRSRGRSARGASAAVASDNERISGSMADTRAGGRGAREVHEAVAKDDRTQREELRRSCANNARPCRRALVRAASDAVCAAVARPARIDGRAPCRALRAGARRNRPGAVRDQLLHDRGAAVAYPRVVSVDPPLLDFFAVAPGAPLAPGRFGILEPAAGEALDPGGARCRLRPRHRLRARRPSPRLRPRLLRRAPSPRAARAAHRAVPRIPAGRVAAAASRRRAGRPGPNPARAPSPPAPARSHPRRSPRDGPRHRPVSRRARRRRGRRDDDVR